MKVLSMIVFDAEPKVPDTEIFPQQTIVDLNSDITFIVLFCQEKHLRWKEINKHTHMHSLIWLALRLLQSFENISESLN